MNSNDNKLFGMLVMTLVMIASAQAYTQMCLSHNQEIAFSACNPNMNDYICDFGLCQVCVNEVSPGIFCPAHPNHCNDLACNQSGEQELDVTPPNVTVNSPEEGGHYNSRRTLVDLEFTEPASVYYYDNQDSRASWKRLCSNCDREYMRDINFDEGFNNITFRVMDRNDNEAFETRTFLVDSRDPRIRRTEPRRGFTSGQFSIEFIEAHPDELTLHYGPLGGNPSMHEVDIDADCMHDEDVYFCESTVDLDELAGGPILYWYTLTDKGGNEDASRPIELDVDLFAPVILGLEYIVDGKYVTFSLNVLEEYLDEVGYSYIDERGRLQEKRLCSRLDDGLCEKRVSFRDGTYNLTVYVRDEVGNMVGENIALFIDSKKPKIKDTMPDGTFASGFFSVNFDEDNPASVKLFYNELGVPEQSMVSLEVELCEPGERDTTLCETTLDLSGYEDKDIEYYFVVTDMSGNTATSRTRKVTVDTQAPVIHNLDSFWEQGEGRYERYLYFNLNVTEPNLDAISYIDFLDTRPRMRTLCSRLRDGICDTRKNFRDGPHHVRVEIRDESGNVIVLPDILFTVDD